jgi:hypothetical protein
VNGNSTFIFGALSTTASLVYEINLGGALSSATKKIKIHSLRKWDTIMENELLKAARGSRKRAK